MTSFKKIKINDCYKIPPIKSYNLVPQLALVIILISVHSYYHILYKIYKYYFYYF